MVLKTPKSTCEVIQWIYLKLKSSIEMRNIDINKVEVLSAPSESSKRATDHYSNLKDHKRSLRSDLDAIGLRKLNNWIKSVLIDQFCPRKPIVLDLCCGKGGDLMKWRVQGASFVAMVDGASESVKSAMNRYNGLLDSEEGIPFKSHFAIADCFRVRLKTIKGFYPFPEEPLFDLVSCQFALHYAFESEERLRAVLQNVSDNLRPGGAFIGTIPDASMILSNAKRSEEEYFAFGSDICRVRFTSETLPDLSEKPFGQEYYFHLQDAVEDLPEFLVHFPTLQRIAEEFGLELVLKANFHRFFLEFVRDEKYYRLLHQLGVFNETTQFPEDDWTTASLYQAFAFRKKNDVPYVPPWDLQKFEPSSVDEDDILCIIES